MKRLVSVFIGAFVLFSAQVQAHHSRANFDNDKDLELTGKVIDYSWRNPHVYVEIEVLDKSGKPKTWLVEAHSVTGMKGKGWSRDTLIEGSSVTIVGHPDRNPEKAFMLMSYIQKPGEDRLYAFNRGPKNKDDIEPSTDFSGTWDLDFSRFNVKQAGGGPPKWSYTDAAQAQADAYSVNDNPELTCHPIGVPKIVIYPYAINWFREGDVIRIEKEHLDESRTIYLNPEAVANKKVIPSYVGTSIGRFESKRHLVVETTGFLPTPWGNANGIDSSEQKKVTEHYHLAEDGLSMEIRYTIEDPVYLTEPATATGGYFKAKSRAFEKLGCDQRTASRHLEVE